MRNGCYSTNRDAVAVINELTGRLNEFGEQCNTAQAQGGGTHLDETKFQVTNQFMNIILFRLYITSRRACFVSNYFLSSYT